MVDYSGFHLGIVVENDDPNYGGRIKVFVPEHMPNLDKVKKWISDGKDIVFRSIDSDMSPELVEILDDLKQCLPWAEYAGPIFGGSGNGRFRCATKSSSVNDGVSFGRSGAEDGSRPLNNYVGAGAQIDDFTRADSNSTLVNPNGGDYEPTNYSGMVRGIFSIPNVGSQVYVFYRGNDPMFPVYFAAGYSQDSMQQIFSQHPYIAKSKSALGLLNMHDYPGDFENSNNNTDNSKIFRSKTVLNSNKNTIELIDSDGRESIKIQHYGGGFKEFNNDTNIEFAPSNDQKLVLGNQFNTVKGSMGISIGGTCESKIGGSCTEQIGHYCDIAQALVPLKEKLESIGEIHQLFTVRRTDFELTPKDCSPLQKREPIGTGFTRCPTCGGLLYDPYLTNGLNVGGTYHNENELSAGMSYNEFFAKYENESTKYVEQKDTEKDWTDTSKMSRVEYGWSRIPKAKSYCISLFETPEPYFYKNHGEHAGAGKLGVFGGIKCPTCNNVFWNTGDQTKQWAIENNQGRSPSTENGTWAVETRKTDPEIANALGDAEFSTAGVFSEIGDQGDKVENITMSKVENIGAMFNDLPSYRVDPIGKLRLDGLFVTQQSVVPYYLPTPHVEPVEVPNVPGGDYNLTIGNKWNVSVGSNGIIIHTTGRMELAGGISEIATQELIMSAKHDMVIDGGERLMLRARKMTINPVEHNALSIDGQLHVLRNEIVRGGLLVEGETALQHVTAPGEIAITSTEMYTGGETEACPVQVRLQFGEAATEAFSTITKEIRTDKQSASPHSGEKVKYKKGTVSSKSVDALITALQEPIDAILYMPVHQHTFLQIPTSFKDCPNGVRASLLREGNNINSRPLILSARRRHHVGAMVEDEAVASLYNKNKLMFDKVVWKTLVSGRPAMAANLTIKECVAGCTTEPGNPYSYGLLGGSYSDGDTGILIFYTVRDYYNNTTNPYDKGIVAKSAFVHAKITFKLTGDSDDVYSQDDSKTKFDSEESGLSSAEKDAGFRQDTIKGDMVADSDYLQKSSKKCEAQLKAWLAKFEAPI